MKAFIYLLFKNMIAEIELILITLDFAADTSFKKKYVSVCVYTLEKY